MCQGFQGLKAFQRISLPNASSLLKSLAGNCVPVRVRSPAPKQYNPNQIFRVGNGFGLFVYFTRYEYTYFANGWQIRPESKPRGPRDNLVPAPVTRLSQGFTQPADRQILSNPLYKQVLVMGQRRPLHPLGYYSCCQE